MWVFETRNTRIRAQKVFKSVTEVRDGSLREVRDGSLRDGSAMSVMEVRDGSLREVRDAITVMEVCVRCVTPSR